MVLPNRLTLNYSFILLFLCLGTGLWAHDPHTAIYTFSEYSSTTEVTAEFPWLLRNAMMAFQPALKEAKTREAYMAVLKAYVSSHFVLSDKTGKSLPLIDIIEKKDPNHHSGTFLMIFEGTEVAKVYNNILLDFSPKHQNFHTVQKAASPYSFITSGEIKTHWMDALQKMNIPLLIGLFGLGFLVLFTLFRRRKTPVV